MWYKPHPLCGSQTPINVGWEPTLEATFVMYSLQPTTITSNQSHTWIIYILCLSGIILVKVGFHTNRCQSFPKCGLYVVVFFVDFHIYGSAQDCSNSIVDTLEVLKSCINTLRPRQNGRHLPDDIFKCISLNENIWISIEISLKFVRKGSINNIPALVLIMAWRQPGDKPLSGPMMVRLPTHICVTRPQWVKPLIYHCY